MESINKNEYQIKLNDLQEWHKDRFQEFIALKKETLLSISLYALTQFLITKELYQLNKNGDE